MTTEQDNTPNGFEALGISGPLLANAKSAGLLAPKPIQQQAIGPMLEGRDVLAIAQTGSGKTAAFALPLLSSIVALGTKRTPRSCRALILAPTRELAVQIEETIRTLAKGLHISTALVLGGVSRGQQVKRLAAGVDFLVATPGRLTDLVREGDIKLAETRWLVLDEADRMLDMGFINDVRRIARATHPKRQTALFSATMPGEIAELADTFMKDPARIAVAPQGTTAAEIRQSVRLVLPKQKRAILSRLLADEAMRSVIVFARTKHGADKVTRNLEADGFSAAVIHGNKSQNARQKALNGFRGGEVRVLVATDIAARGIDVPGITHVVNYDLPDEAESYVHRIGRTGRNGADGTAITLCDPTEAAKLRSVEKVIRMRLAVEADHREEDIPYQAPARAPRAAAANSDERPGRSSPKPFRNKGPQGKTGGQNGNRANRHAPPQHGAAAEGGDQRQQQRKPFRRKRPGNRQGQRKAA